MSRYDSVIFDFDGTVYDSTGSITACFRHALQTVCGIEETDAGRLRTFVGPPLIESFRTYCLPENLLHACIDDFRSYYGSTLELTFLFPGMLELLRGLKEAGIPAAIASTKQSGVIEGILRRDSALQYFDAVCGPLDDYEPEGKPVLIGRAVELLGNRAGRPCMVGDRFYDAAGARDAGIDFVAAGYGPGRREEFADFPMVHYAESIEDLRSFLLG